MRRIPQNMIPVYNRLTDLLWGRHIDNTAIHTASEAPSTLLDSLVPGNFPDTFCFPDLDYSDQCASLWQAKYHYGRLLQAVMAAGKEALHTDTAFQEKLTGALRYWTRNDFINPNWWHNMIGTPRNLADLTLLAYDILPDDVLHGLLPIISRGSLGGENDREIRTWTGANLIWGVADTIRYALLTGNEELLTDGVSLAAKELAYNREGIQPDGSFFQHGPRLYSGGYGRAFAMDMGQFAYILQETEWQFSPEQLGIFTRHILDGLRYMTKGTALDYVAVGREFTRPGGLHSGGLRPVVSLMLQTAEMPRKEELAEYAAELNGTRSLSGTRYFPDAAFLCHHTGGIYIGAKFLTNKLHDAEVCNGEGILCYNMSYGSHTCVMADGSEYWDISPVWDYARIPGTTASQESDAELVTHSWCGKPLPNAISGGMQKDQYAVIYELAEHGGIKTLAADFAFPGGFICLGTGISTEEEQPLTTTVEQCHLQGAVSVENRHIIHHGVRYTPLDQTEFRWETKSVTGSWQRNSKPESPAPVEGTLFSITIDHAASAVFNGHTSAYAYMISPAAEPVPFVTVLRNDREVQAVCLADGTVMAVFYAPASLEAGDRLIEEKAGCYIL